MSVYNHKNKKREYLVNTILGGLFTMVFLVSFTIIHLLIT